MPELSHDDVSRLLHEPTPAMRVLTAQKVTAAFSAGKLKPNERSIAEEIFRIMLRDTDVSVRQSLSENLKNDPTVAHDVAMSLAKDVAEVAVPMLNCSIVFTDDDLIEIVRTRPVACQLAIAGRERVAPTVSEALAETEEEEVVVTLARNPGAEIEDRTYGKVIDLFSRSEVVMDSLASRPTLPVKHAERLVALVSENIRLQLLKSDRLPSSSEHLIRHNQEKATLALLTDDGEEHDAEELVDQIESKGRLTPTIILRALCVGHFEFFEAAMAHRAVISVANAQRLIHDQGPLGLDSLCRAAELPTAMNDIFRVGIEIAQGLWFDGGREGRDAYQAALIDHMSGDFAADGIENIEALLAKFNEMGVTAGAG